MNKLGIKSTKEERKDLLKGREKIDFKGFLEIFLPENYQ
jgi:hypothetical protein